MNPSMIEMSTKHLPSILFQYDCEKEEKAFVEEHALFFGEYGFIFEIDELCKKWEDYTIINIIDDFNKYCDIGKHIDYEHLLELFIYFKGQPLCKYVYFSSNFEIIPEFKTFE